MTHVSAAVGVVGDCRECRRPLHIVLVRRWEWLDAWLVLGGWVGGWVEQRGGSLAGCPQGAG